VVRFVAAKSAEHDRPQNAARTAGHPFWAEVTAADDGFPGKPVPGAYTNILYNNIGNGDT